MEIEEFFDYRKVMRVDRDIQESHYHVDISDIKEEREKIEKAIESLLGFLVNSGLSPQEVFGVFTATAQNMLNHPDNHNFSINSLVEEQVNEDKEREAFLENVRSSEDLGFLKEVYRSWVITHLKVEEKED
jgi:hypothetical protein